MQGSPRSVVVAGGAGFIGSAFVRMLLAEGYERVRVFDKLTYAGNLNNLADVAAHPGYSFVQGDICDPGAVNAALAGFDALVNFAAESHVDRSLLDPGAFIQTDVYGVFVLLEAARTLGLQRVVHVSTDEVYGQVMQGFSTESDLLRPRNPYSASKAGGEMMVMSFVETYGLPAVITRGSNTYGPYQYPEKFIPLATTNVLRGLPIPVYGDGRQVRDWMHVDDHAAGIKVALERGEIGAVYNVGGGNERENIDVATRILRELDAPAELLHHVQDRPGHDRRYAVDTTRIRALGWAPQVPFEEGLVATARWYRERRDWWQPLIDGDLAQWHDLNYAKRGSVSVDAQRGTSSAHPEAE